MKFEIIQNKDKLSSMVDAFEKELKVNITIHDVRGILSLQESNRILPGRFLHQHPFCRKERFSRPAWNNRCTNECKNEVYSQLWRYPCPMVKTCWKNVTEVVVPIIKDNQLMLILYAGLFKEPNDDNCSKQLENFSQFYQEIFNQLPILTNERKNQLISCLTILGNAILFELKEFDEISKSSSREQQILSFIKKNATKNVSVLDLANHLHLSLSRTEHTVKELLGKSFKELLLDERMAIATCLLNSNPNLLIGKIAKSCGFADERYFSRCFRKFFGMSPKNYQQESMVKKQDTITTKK